MKDEEEEGQEGISQQCQRTKSSNSTRKWGIVTRRDFETRTDEIWKDELT
jgi:hypothetical protein